MYKNALIITLLLLTVAVGRGQGEGLQLVEPGQVAAEAQDTSRWDFHLTTGVGMVASQGEVQPLMWVAPRFEYHATDRLTLCGGFASVGSMLDSYRLHGYGDRSLAPLKHRTGYVALHGGAEYRVSDHLRVWGEVWHVAGMAQPWWDPTGDAVNADATALSGGFEYEFSEGNVLGMSFSFIRAANPWLYANPYYGYCAGMNPYLGGHTGLWGCYPY